MHLSWTPASTPLGLLSSGAAWRRGSPCSCLPPWCSTTPHSQPSSVTWTTPLQPNSSLCLQPQHSAAQTATLQQPPRQARPCSWQLLARLRRQSLLLFPPTAASRSRLLQQAQLSPGVLVACWRCAMALQLCLLSGMMWSCGSLRTCLHALAASSRAHRCVWQGQGSRQRVVCALFHHASDSCRPTDTSNQLARRSCRGPDLLAC